MELVTKADIARLFGIRRSGVGKIILLSARNNFPAPIRAGVWDKAAVTAWRLANPHGKVASRPLDP